MTFRFPDCEISPLYEEFCAIMDYSPPNEEYPALPPSPNASLQDLLGESPIPIIPEANMPYPHNIPLAPFLQRAYNFDGSPQWSHCFCYLLLNVFAMVSPVNGYGNIPSICSSPDCPRESNAIPFDSWRDYELGQ